MQGFGYLVLGINFNKKSQEMNLNPFHPNYLNQMTFNNRNQNTRKESSVPVKTESKQTNRATYHDQSLQQPTQSHPDVLSAQFPQEHRFFTSHLTFTNQGFLLAFLRKDHKISGRSFLLFPQGIIASCNVINHKLSGWISICKRDEFYNLSHFSLGRLNGLQYAYDLKCGITLESEYRSGRLQSVKRGVADSQLSFQRCLKSKELVDLLHTTLSQKFLLDYFPKIQSSLGVYYGCKHKEMPSGLGVLFTEDQCFYGNFNRGLLSGQGAMIFPNGNNYVGEFQEGMMRGYGHLYVKGSSQYKLNDTIISQEQYQSGKKIASFENNYELFSIFGPIVQFYIKLKHIYQSRRKEPEQEQSFVDVKLEHKQEEEEYVEEEHSMKSQASQEQPQENIMSELMRTNTRQTLPPPIQKKDNRNQAFRVSLTPVNNRSKQQQAQPKEKQKQEVIVKKKKERLLIRDQDWNEIIEELAEQTISKQDDFLKPKEEPLLVDDPQPLRKNPLNARVYGQGLNHLTDNHTDVMDRLENQLIGKIVKKN